MQILDELIQRISELPAERVDELRQVVLHDIKKHPFAPNPGPQTEAYYSEADELFYGGQAGGGKSRLLVGLALNEHQKSIIFRRVREDARDLFNSVAEVLPKDIGKPNKSLLTWEIERNNKPCTVRFGGLPYEWDKQKHKGNAHDLYGFDEIGDFLKSQYSFVIGWNRSADLGQRCRVVCTGNPPTTAEGLWVIDYWGPWIDPDHKNPEKPGVLRWYTTNENDESEEVDGPGPHLIKGEQIWAKSRTFIPAKLTDNPDLNETSYHKVLAALPAEIRDAYRDGRFDKSVRDNPWQVIPTSWIIAAQDRWKEMGGRPPAGTPMCSLGVDCAQGGADSNVIIARYDYFFATPVKVPGRETPLGTSVAGHVIANRRDGALVIVDCGGGFGGTTFAHLKDNGVNAKAYIGGSGSSGRTVDKTLTFNNFRCESYWRMREALDPSQEGGASIALPPSAILRADLSAPMFTVRGREIQIESKESVCSRLGRSPDEGDAAIMAFSDGPRMSTNYKAWKEKDFGGRGKPQPVVRMGHTEARR